MDADTFIESDACSEILDEIGALDNSEVSNAIVNGSIAAACFKSAFSDIGVCSECVDEFSMEFARQRLSSQHQEFWLHKWRQDENSGRLKSTRFHFSSQTLPNIERVSGSQSFIEVVREVASSSQSGLVLDFEEYVSYLRKRVRRLVATLDSAELRIVDLLIRNKDFDNIAVAKAIGISPEWASRKVNDLRSRWIHRRFDRVPFSRIGIRMYNLFLASDRTELDILATVEKFPFLYSYQRVLTGNWDSLAVLSVPDNQKSIRLLESLPRILGKSELDVLLLEIASSGVATCFDHYDVPTRNWHLPWELLEMHLRRIYTDGLARAIGRIDTPASRTDIELDDLDMKIIEQMRLGNTSIAKIRTNLKIGQQKTASRVRRLREGGLIDTLWEVHNIGLIESIIVSSEDVEAGEAIAAWARRLPRSIISFNSDRHLSLVAQLPQGGSYGLTRSLSFISHLVDVGLLDEKIYGGWGFPIQLWDGKRHAWLHPEKEVDSWLASLDTS